VLLVDQPCTTLVLLPSNSIHLNCCGAVPPDTAAVNVIGVPPAAVTCDSRSGS
jgi:hypothetical protein